MIRAISYKTRGFVVPVGSSRYCRVDRNKHNDPAKAREVALPGRGDRISHAYWDQKRPP